MTETRPPIGGEQVASGALAGEVATELGVMESREPAAATGVRVLPQPDGPSRAKKEPRGISTVSPSHGRDVVEALL